MIQNYQLLAQSFYSLQRHAVLREKIKHFTHLCSNGIAHGPDCWAPRSWVRIRHNSHSVALVSSVTVRYTQESNLDSEIVVK